MFFAFQRVMYNGIHCVIVDNRGKLFVVLREYNGRVAVGKKIHALIKDVKPIKF